MGTPGAFEGFLKGEDSDRLRREIGIEGQKEADDFAAAITSEGINGEPSTLKRWFYKGITYTTGFTAALSDDLGLVLASAKKKTLGIFNTISAAVGALWDQITGKSLPDDIPPNLGFFGKISARISDKLSSEVSEKAYADAKDLAIKNDPSLAKNSDFMDKLVEFKKGVKMIAYARGMETFGYPAPTPNMVTTNSQDAVRRPA